VKEARDARSQSVAFEAMVERSFEGQTLGQVDRTLVFLASSELSDGRVSVRVRVSHTEVQPPLGVNTWSSGHTFLLLQEEDAWRIDSLDWPAVCR
jgi:hypothetical protein